MFFSLAGLDFAASWVISRMFWSFKKTCLLKEVKLLEWACFFVLKSLTHRSYEQLKLSSHKHLTWKTCNLLALA